MPSPLDMPDQELLAKVCESQPAISARIRTLAAAGWPRSKIARALGKRPQHVWNVLGPVDKHARIAAAPESLPAPGPVVCDSEYFMDALKNAKVTSKQPVNLSINSSLLDAARRLPINMSETLESSLVTRLRHEAMLRWQAENREAIEERNKFFETHGLWSDGLRQF